jgi:tRNA(Ile)-lysidine synthase
MEDEAIQYRIVRLILSLLQNENEDYIYPQGKDLTFDVIERIAGHICNGQSGRKTEGGRNIFCLIEHDYARLYVLSRKEIDKNQEMSLSIEFIDISFDEIESKVKSMNDWVAYFDKAVIDQLCIQQASDIKIRPAVSGDCFVPFGSKGHVTMQKFLIDKKVPLSMRRNVNVVCIGNEIIWIPGLRRSNLARVTKNTKQIVKLTIK